ncbi:S-layer homology domain-containing protein [Paenibacillus urinalis]
MMLANALKWQDEKQKKAEQAELSFTDNDKIGAWAKDAIAQSIERRVITAYTDGSFRPNQEITRTEMIVMLVRALGIEPVELEQTGFADDAAIPTWGKGAVEALRELGLMTGRSNNSFAPHEAATRAEAIVIIMRILDLDLNHQ